MNVTVHGHQGVGASQARACRPARPWLCAQPSCWVALTPSCCGAGWPRHRHRDRKGPGCGRVIAPQSMAVSVMSLLTDASGLVQRYLIHKVTESRFKRTFYYV